MAKNCPNKKTTSRPIKAIEDGSLSAITASALNGFFVIDHEGFQKVPTKAAREEFKNMKKAVGIKATTSLAEGLHRHRAHLQGGETNVHRLANTRSLAPPKIPPKI